MYHTLRSRARKLFGMQLYINNARELFLILDWLQHAHSARGVYE